MYVWTYKEPISKQYNYEFPLFMYIVLPFRNKQVKNLVDECNFD
jgi:hypothetical protein